MRGSLPGLRSPRGFRSAVSWGADGEPFWRIDLGVAMPVDMYPHDEEQYQRDGNVNEDHEREEPPAQRGVVNEIACNRLAEKR